MNKRNLKLKKNISRFITKILISIFLILTIIILKMYHPNLLSIVKENIFNKSINFAKINNLSKKLIGKDVIYSKEKSELVSNNDAHLSNVEDYHDGEKIKISNKMPIGLLTSGIVIFKGEKDYFGKTIIVQGIDGYNIWYGNLENINVKPYSYLEKNELIGNILDEYIYLLIEKDGKRIKYEDYIKNKN